MAQTLFDKIWNAHVVENLPDNGPSVIYIDQHLIHEVTSPQAFEGLRKRNIGVFRKKRVLGTADHNVPTLNQHLPITEELSRFQVQKLTDNCKVFEVELFSLGHKDQGIVHVIGPELGITQPGMTMVCGDSHTSTHGAFGTIAFGIGTSEVEMVLATQCLLQQKPKQMRININGKLNKNVGPKDVILHIISKLSAAGGTGYFVEYAGNVFSEMSMEGRMTVCNMSIEMGARGGLIAPDSNTFDYVKGKRFAPQGTAFEQAIEKWKMLFSDPNATFDAEFHFNAEDILPMITYGTNPGMGIGITENIPNSQHLQTESEKAAFKKSLDYMGLKEGESLLNKPIDYVFIGSCTNSRIEDLRLVAQVVKGKSKAPHVHVFIVPGSQAVERQAKEEGLDKIFQEAGFELRQAGCSACLGMNEDKIPAGKYCVSTSNRNFEGRQGPGARTLLASPLTAAIAAITGKISDVQSVL